jgi:hypothetical protein
MKMHIKRSSDHSTQSIDLKAHIFIENRETKMIVAKKLHMKIQSTPTQTGLKGN